MDRELLRRIVWVGSLVLVLALATLVMIWRGVEWGLGAAP